MTEVWQSPVRPWHRCGPKTQKALRAHWSAGDLSYKLDPEQLKVYLDIKAKLATAKSAADRWYALDIGRQWGKDRVMATLAVETAIKSPPKSRIAYGAPTLDEASEIVEPIINDLFEDCPPDLRPKYLDYKHRWIWPNGTRIVMVGCDLYPHRLRGPGARAVFLTEPAFMDNLDRPVKGVMAVIDAQLLEYPDAFRVYGSTPPETPAHPWSTKFIPRAKARGFYAHRTIWDCPRWTKETKKGFIEEAGGAESTRARREYFAEHVVEESRMIIPEWLEAKKDCVCEFERPAHFDAYVSLDPGWTHLCAGLFAYWNFDTATLDIEADFAVARANSRDISRIIRAREWQLWGTEPWRDPRLSEEEWNVEIELMRSLFYPDLPDPEVENVSRPRWNGSSMAPQPYQRYSDTDIRMIADLQSEHRLLFSPTAKDNRDAAINALRVRVQKRQVRIHPRCSTLIAHLDHGIWNKNKTQFAESSEDGHFDTISALVYLDRNVIRGKNPYLSETHGIDPHNHTIERWAMNKTETAEALRTAFMGPVRRRNAMRRKYAKRA